MSTHVVKQGECLSRIAAAYGISDWRRLYDHPDNAALKKKRPNPHLLFPGDKVVIPEPKESQAPAATGKLTKFVVKLPKREIEVRMLDEHGAPLGGERYTAELDGNMVYGKTDGDGVLKLRLSGDTSVVEIWIAGQVRTLRIGELNPMDEALDDGVSGVQGRLLGLGFNPGPIDGDLGPRTRAALIAFQRHYKLQLTGEADDATRARLKKEYRA